jgi:hypothetical protein
MFMLSSAVERNIRRDAEGQEGRGGRGEQTFEEFAAVDLAGGYFEGYDMALRKRISSRRPGFK